MIPTFIIVLGNPKPLYYEERVDRGMETFFKLYNEEDKNKVMVIMTGFNGESTKMKKYAMRKYGEQYSSVILEETKSVNTHQNLLFSKQIIESMCSSSYSVIVCTSTFHIDRSLILANLVFGTDKDVYSIKMIHTRSPIPEDRREREKMLLDNLITSLVK